VTFTFQTLVEGRMLPYKHEEWTAWIQTQSEFSSLSYQMAYLFVWLVGKGDAWSCNTLYNRRFYEVDNEVIGEFPYTGVLHRFASLKSYLICNKVLQSILKASRSELFSLLNSYTEKNRFLFDLWCKEKSPPNTDHVQTFFKLCPEIPSGIVQRL